VWFAVEARIEEKAHGEEAVPGMSEQDKSSMPSTILCSKARGISSESQNEK